MSKKVNAILTHQEKQAAGTSRLLRHCQSMGTSENRVPARIRLERAIGPEFARRLVTSLTAHSRR